VPITLKIVIDAPSRELWPISPNHQSGSETSSVQPKPM